MNRIEEVLDGVFGGAFNRTNPFGTIAMKRQPDGSWVAHTCPNCSHVLTYTDKVNMYCDGCKKSWKEERDAKTPM